MNTYIKNKRLLFVTLNNIQPNDYNENYDKNSKCLRFVFAERLTTFSSEISRIRGVHLTTQAQHNRSRFCHNL